MSGARRALAAFGAALLASACGREAAPTTIEVLSPVQRLERDDRIAYLLADCPRNEAFLADTSDMVAVLVDKLQNGQVDPLKEAKAELAELGPAALPELTRFFEDHFKDPQGAPWVQNALVVARLFEQPIARELLLRGLEHPQEFVRLAAVRGLQKHATRADYDRLASLLPISAVESQGEIATALFASDRDRLEDDFCRWFGENKYPGTWVIIALNVCDTTRASTLACFRTLADKTTGDLRFHVMAALARNGDQAALEQLRAWLKDPNSARRASVASAVEKVGLTRELFAPFQQDSEPRVRATAAHAIAQLPVSEETTALLAAGLADLSDDVRELCLAALIERGDASARNEALELLKGEQRELELALRALRKTLDVDPELCARALSILLRLHSGELQPVRVQAHRLERAIGQMPHVDATRFLYELARSAPGSIEGLPAHRFYLQLCGNTGRAGQPYLMERWRAETDALRRVDILTAIAFQHDEPTRDFLLAAIEDARTTPLEVLYLADLLVHRGPALRIAPLLKRLTLRVEDPLVRPALHCLLWQWYG